MADMASIGWFLLVSLGSGITLVILYHAANLLREKSYRPDLRRSAPYLGQLYIWSSECITDFGVYHRKRLVIGLVMLALIWFAAFAFDALVEIPGSGTIR